MGSVFTRPHLPDFLLRVVAARLCQPTHCFTHLCHQDKYNMVCGPARLFPRSRDNRCSHHGPCQASDSSAQTRKPSALLASAFVRLPWLLRMPFGLVTLLIIYLLLLENVFGSDGLVVFASEGEAISSSISSSQRKRAVA